MGVIRFGFGKVDVLTFVDLTGMFDIMSAQQLGIACKTTTLLSRLGRGSTQQCTLLFFTFQFTLMRIKILFQGCDIGVAIKIEEKIPAHTLRLCLKKTWGGGGHTC